MATTISCAVDGAEAFGMQVTLRCIGYGPATFKGYGYVDDTGQIGHDFWQFRGSRSSTTMAFLEEDESRTWVMAFDTGSCYPVASECYWPAIEVNFTFKKGDRVLISLRLGRQSYTCSRLTNPSFASPPLTVQNRAITYPSGSCPMERTVHRQHSYGAAARSSSELQHGDHHWNQRIVPRYLRDESPRLQSMPSCSKGTAERVDRLEEHKDTLKEWLSDDHKRNHRKKREQNPFPLASTADSRELESAEILLKLSRLPVPTAKQNFPVSPEIESGTRPIGASLKCQPEPRTSTKEIMTWVDTVNQVHVEATCALMASEILGTGMATVLEQEAMVDDKKRAVSECEDTIEVEVPELKKTRRTRLSVIRGAL